jgi:hypothetical protein
VAGRAPLIGGVHGDVQSSETDSFSRGGEAAGVAELGEDRHRGELADPVVDHQRLAARLAAGVAAQLLVERRELAVQRIDHGQRHGEPARVRWLPAAGQTTTPIRRG